MPRDKQRDEFGDVANARRCALESAGRLGHDMGRFAVRLNDDTKANSFCRVCNALLVVNSEPGGGLPESYGHALTMHCMEVM